MAISMWPGTPLTIFGLVPAASCRVTLGEPLIHDHPAEKELSDGKIANAIGS